MCVGPSPAAPVAAPAPAAAAPRPIPAQLVQPASGTSDRAAGRSALASKLGTAGTSPQGLGTEANTAKKTLLGV